MCFQRAKKETKEMKQDKEPFKIFFVISSGCFIDDPCKISTVIFIH